MDTTIYVTGSGIISAIGVGKAQTLDALLAKRSGIGPLCHLETCHKELPAGEVKLSDREMRTMLGLADDMPANRTSLMGSIALREALSDAHLLPEDLLRAGYLISGTTVGGMDYTERHYLDMLADDTHLSLLRTHECGATTEVMARAAGLGNVRMTTLSTACSSAANAIIMGCNLIKTGRADIVVAGGSESLSKFHFNGFNSLMILDSQPCRPFDADRAGLNLGEGAAFVVLESEASARRRGATPLIRISGYGNACDAFHQTASSDNGEGAFRAMRQALETAGLTTTDIDYINAHGTATPNNDVSEGTALQRIFGEAVPPVSSTKSFTGHTTSASGSIEAVVCELALTHGFIPANLGWTKQIPGGITPTPGKAEADLRHVMCNSFGFGGNDSSLVLSKVTTATHPLPATHHCEVYVRAVSLHKAGEPSADVGKYLPKLEARRMCKLLKSAIFTSKQVLEAAGIERPDGIITATEYGMLENSEKFLTQMCRDGEELLKPTLFMQSTHNTIGGVLAILTKCHGYNVTFSHGRQSLRDAVLDARLQFEQGNARTLLVGYHNELTPTFSDMEHRLYGTRRQAGEASVALLLTTEADGAVAKLEELDLDALLREVSDGSKPESND